MRAGNFSNPIFPAIYDPTTHAPFPGNVIPSSRFDTLATAVEQCMPMPNLRGYVNNYQIPLPSTNPQLRWFGRIDYNATTNNRVTFSIMQQDFPSFGQAPGDISQAPYPKVGTSNPQSQRPFPQFQTISGNPFNAISNYDSLQLTAKSVFQAGSRLI